MLSISDEDLEKIRAVLADDSPLDAIILEKDILVTRAIIALSQLEIPDASLVFCGGTCLSKAHRLIRRMSEDIDFKLQIDLDGSPSQARKKRSKIKNTIQNHLEASGFREIECGAGNGNKFFTYDIKYQSHYPERSVLRPFIKIECVNLPPFLQTSLCKIKRVSKL